MAAILHDSTAVVVAVRTRPRAIPLAVITTRKSIHGFPLVPYMGMGLRLAALRAAGAPLWQELLLVTLTDVSEIRQYKEAKKKTLNTIFAAIDKQ